MVKAVIGEETRLQLRENRLSASNIPSQVGLVIGKLSSSSDRCLVFDLIPTPANDAGESACSIVRAAHDDRKKGGKGKPHADSSSVLIDRDWVAEHARQVSRMLLGGIEVLGIYVWISETSFKNSTIELCQTVKVVSEAAPLHGTDWDERLLIHISYSPRRWTCRNCTLSSNIMSSNLRPCDFKMGKVLNSIQTFKCTYSFDLRLPICRESGSNFRKLADVIRKGILSHAKELKGAKAIIDGNLVVEEELCASDGLHEVQFLLPFMKNLFVACSQKEVLGVLVFSGSVCSYSYLNSKEPISQALGDLKGDTVKSLLSRLDIMSDEADVESSPTVGAAIKANGDLPAAEQILQRDLHLLRKYCILSFPRRIFVPWLAGTYICDYLQSSETIEVVKDHCAELMSMEALTDMSTILEPECDSLTLCTKSFSDITVPFSSVSNPESSSSKIKGIVLNEDKKSKKQVEFNVFAAVLVLILGILVGMGLYIIKTSNC